MNANTFFYPFYNFINSVLSVIRNLKKINTCISVILLLICYYTGSSSTITSTGSGNWNSTIANSPWPNGAIPSSTDTVVISNTSAVTVNVNATCGRLTINSGGTLNIGAYTITINGATEISGTLNITSATNTKIFNGDITINSGGIWNETATATVSCSGNFTNNASTFTTRTGIHTFSGSAKIFSGTTNTSIANVVISGSYTNNGILTITGSLSGSGGLTNGSTGALHIDYAGTVDISSFNASADGNVVDYGFAGNQTVRVTNYHDITLSGSGTKTFTSVVGVSGNFTLNGSSTAVTLPTGFSISGNLAINAGTLTLGMGTTITVSGNVSGGGTLFTGTSARTINIGGNWTHTGTATGTGLTVIFNGTGIQTLAGTNTMNVTVNKSSGEVRLLSDKTIRTLLMSSGMFNPNSYLATINNNFTFNGGTLLVPTTTWALSYSTTPTPAAGTTINYSNANATINGGITYQNLSYSGSGTAGASATLIIQGDLSNTGGGTLDFGSRNVTLNGSVSSNSIAGFATTGTVLMSKTSGTVTFTGNVNGGALTINGNGGTLNLGTGLTHTISGTWTRTNGTLNGGSSTLQIGANISGTGGTFTANTGTVEWNHAGNQTIAGVNYYNLVLSGNGNRTLSAGATVSNNCTLSGSVTTTTISGFTVGGNLVIGDGATFTAAAFAFTVTGATTIGDGASGTLTISSATGVKTFTGNVTINSGASWNNSVNSDITFGSSITNSGTFTAGIGVYTLSGTNKTINGTIAIPNITISGSYINNGTLTVTSTLDGTSLTNGANGFLHIDFTGTPGITTLTATTAGNTVDYGFAGAQTIKSVTYYNLALSGTGAKLFPTAITINNDLFINSGASADLGNNLTHFAHLLYLAGAGQVSGTWGSTSSSATNRNNTFFSPVNGVVSVNDCDGLWQGTSGTDWNTGSNWCNGNVPSSGSNVTIPSGGNQPVITNTAFCKNILISPGATLGISGTNKLTVFGNWTNNGTFNRNNSTVEFAGNAQNISGSATNTFYNLTIGGTGVKTIAAITLNNILSMEGTGTLSAAPTYGASATLQYNTATPRIAGAEWNSPFVSSGGIIIDNTGSISLNADVQIGNNTNVPLNIKSGAHLSTNNFGLTFYGDFINNGIFSAGSSAFTFAGTISQNIAGFATTNAITISKTAGITTMNGNINAGSLDFTGANGTSLSINGYSLTLTGAITLPRPSSAAVTLNVGQGNLSCASLTLGGTNNNSARSTTLLISSGTVTVNGNVSSNGTYSYLTFTGSGTLNAGGTFLNGGATFTAGTGTVNFNRFGNQTISPDLFTFYNLTLSGSGTKTTTDATVNGILLMEGTAATTGTAPAYGTNATLRYNRATALISGIEWITPFTAKGGVIIDSTGIITLNAAKVFGSGAPLTINNGSTLTTANFKLTFGGNFINNGGTFNAGSSAIEITNTAASQKIAGFATTGAVSMTKTAGISTFTGNVTGYSLTLNGNGGTLNLGSNLTHTFSAGAGINVWIRTNGTLNGGSSILRLNGNVSGSTGTFTSDTSTIEYYSNGAQTCASNAFTYNNLTLSGTNVKTFGNAMTVNGILSIEGTATGTFAGITYGSGAALRYRNSDNRTAGAVEWPTPFTASGGVVIDNTGIISLNSDKVFNSSSQLILNSGATLSSNNFLLTIGGNFINNGGTFNTGTGTVIYNGSAQNIADVPYFNLTLSGSGSKNTTGTDVNGTLSMEGTATASSPIAYSGTSTLQYKGSGSQSTTENEFPASNGPANLIINNSNGSVNITLDRTINNNFSIITGSVCNINPGKSLRVNGNTVNNAGTSGLVIKSNASGTGNLIHNNTGVAGTVQRYMTGDVANKPIHYITSPVFNASVGSILQSGDYNVYWYDETNTSATLANSWTRTFTKDTMANGRGYYVVGSYSDRTNIFSGHLTVPSDISASIPVSYTSSGTPANDGWNLIGNPYPCALSATSFITDNLSNFYSGYEAIYYWNDVNAVKNGADDYATRNNTGGIAANGNSGNPPNNKISVGQGFFVKVGAGATSFSMAASQRDSNMSPQFFITDPSLMQRIWISVTGPTDLYNETLLGFFDGATTGLDRSYDAYKLKGNSNIALYSMMDGFTEGFAIQALPLINQKTDVKLGVAAGIAGNYTFRLKDFQNFNPKMLVILKDNANGTVVNIRKDSTYTVALNPGEYQSRFVLEFYPDEYVGIEYKPVSATVDIYTFGNKIFISGYENISYPVTISDVTGRITGSYKLKPGSVTEINTDGLSGIYFVSVVTKNGIVTKKIFFNSDY